ncbi:MAG: zinc-binding dehydrogenase [Alphaproteobacteria bacterium]|nr:zinc-binding dehydrogenase [Alphaproteobacteria bacterium]
MRAVVRRDKALVCDEIAAPQPGPGQTLVKTLACGICGSDLHALHYLDHMVDLTRRAGGVGNLDPSKDVVFGHEYCAEVIEHGAGGGRFKPGARVVAMPVAFDAQGFEAVGYSNRYPGGFAEYMALMEPMLLEVPNGLSAEHAALTEPMAVGAHAVAQSAMEKGSVALVIGCGPVGLAVIASLKAQGPAKGWGAVIAADFSARRREAARAMGADIVVDPGTDDPHGKWTSLGVPDSLGAATMARMGGQSVARPVVFECVGAPGVLQSLIERAPPHAQILVAGVCMETDKIEPSLAINKQLELKFVLGYTPDEFARTLTDIADGIIPVAPLITGECPLEGVAESFTALASPESHVKILVKPGL